MRVVVQRVSEARVVVGGETIGAIGPGMVLFVGFEEGDTDTTSKWMAQKVAGLRLFEDEQGKMNLDAEAVGASILAVPNFTVAGDASQGRRPSFTNAMQPREAAGFFEAFAELLGASGVPVETGRFGAEMHVSLTSDGPVTLVVERRA